MPKRKNYPKGLVQRLLIRCRLRCECGNCNGTKISKKEGIEIDHVPALALRPENEDGTDWVPPQHSEAHLQVLRYPCHKVKTRDDRKKIAKVKRLRGETGQNRKRKVWPKTRKPWAKRSLSSQSSKGRWPKRKMTSRKLTK